LGLKHKIECLETVNFSQGEIIMEKDEIVQKVLKFLTPREGRILKVRLEDHTLQEIGKEFGVTRERVRQIGKKINQKIARNLTKEELKDYINSVRQLKTKSRR